MSSKRKCTDPRSQNPKKRKCEQKHSLENENQLDNFQKEIVNLQTKLISLHEKHYLQTNHFEKMKNELKAKNQEIVSLITELKFVKDQMFFHDIPIPMENSDNRSIENIMAKHFNVMDSLICEPDENAHDNICLAPIKSNVSNFCYNFTNKLT